MERAPEGLEAESTALAPVEGDMPRLWKLFFSKCFLCDRGSLPLSLEQVLKVTDLREKNLPSPGQGQREGSGWTYQR